MAPRYTEDQARQAIAASLSWAESLRRLGMCPTGGGWKVLRKWVEIWEIPTDHFDPRRASLAGLARAAAAGRTPLTELLVEGRRVKTASLKERLYEAGLKQPGCELCGQGEEWRGRRMALILDHINGVNDDNRLENLRIVCPNCNATLETHCGRNGRTIPVERACAHCGAVFRPKYRSHRYCSRGCGVHAPTLPGPRPETRKVERPGLEVLLADVATLGWSGTGRKYGVSDNAIRKWVRQYEREAA